MPQIVIAIATLAGGGAERVAANLANRWQRDGHAVTVVTLASARADDYPLDAGVERLALDVVAPSASHAAALGPSVARVRALRRVLRERRPDIVLGMTTTVNVLIALARTGLGGRLILAERNYPPMSARNRIWSVLRRFVYHRADLVLALNDTCARWLAEHTLARRIESIPNALVWPLPRVEPVRAPEATYPDGARRLLAVGRLVPQKGFERLIEAFAALADDFPDWHLAIVGEGAERERLTARIGSLGLTGRVSLPGRVGNVADWFGGADLYVLSSHHEGFPGALLEAMASGCAVLSVRCLTGPAEIVEDGVDGILVDDDAAALTEGLRRVMGDAALRAALAERAPRVLETYDEASITARWTALFERLGVASSALAPRVVGGNGS